MPLLVHLHAGKYVATSFGPGVSEDGFLFELNSALLVEWGFTPEDAFIFLSVACDAGVAQACKPAPGFGTIARFVIPKLDATPGPFSP